MKSAIGIGSLLVDRLEDTVWVSLTEDPEFELVPCKTLIAIGEERSTSTATTSTRTSQPGKRHTETSLLSPNERDCCHNNNQETRPT